MPEQRNAPSRKFFLNPAYWKIRSKILGTGIARVGERLVTLLDLNQVLNIQEE